MKGHRLQARASVGEAGKPKAFLNWLLLDEQFKFVPAGSGFMPVEEYSSEMQTLAQSGIEVPKSGYLFVYLSNETVGENVFFDNLVVQHYTGPLTETTDYTPWGLDMKMLGSKASGRLENKYKYNGIEQNNDFDLNMYDARYRNLDPQIGRFWQIDPKPTDDISLYAAMNNNPIRFADPLGDTVKVKTGFLGLRKLTYDENTGKLYKNNGISMLVTSSPPYGNTPAFRQPFR